MMTDRCRFILTFLLQKNINYLGKLKLKLNVCLDALPCYIFLTELYVSI
jgi:hypothetical protein